MNTSHGKSRTQQRKALLQAVMKASEEQAAMFNKETVAARRDATATAMLPKSFDSVRAVFGPCGPSVMPMQKVRCQLTLLPGSPDI